MLHVYMNVHFIFTCSCEVYGGSVDISAKVVLREASSFPYVAAWFAEAVVVLT